MTYNLEQILTQNSQPTFTALLRSLAIIGLVALPSTAAFAQQKTVKQCTEEWRANKADNQAKGITEKAFVAQCRPGGTAAPPAPAPTPAPAPPPPPAG